MGESNWRRKQFSLPITNLTMSTFRRFRNFSKQIKCKSHSAAGAMWVMKCHSERIAHHIDVGSAHTLFGIPFHTRIRARGVKWLSFRTFWRTLNVIKASLWQFYCYQHPARALPLEVYRVEHQNFVKTWWKATWRWYLRCFAYFLT